MIAPGDAIHFFGPGPMCKPAWVMQIFSTEGAIRLATIEQSADDVSKGLLRIFQHVPQTASGYGWHRTDECMLRGRGG